jgi:PAS domain S-box-containing protein
MNPAPDSTGISQSEPSFKPARVLLVDDRKENLQALEAILEPLGVETARAMSAEEVLRRVLAEEFAVILLDIQMPGTDGIEIARLLKTREKSRATPIIFLTALDHDRRRVTSAYQSGAVDYITKPLDPDMLRAKVSSFVELHRKREETTWRERRRYADAAIRESEERYRLVAQATNDVIWDWDLLTNVQLWNEQAFQTFRYRREQVEDDISWWENRVHVDDRERVVNGMKAVIADPLGHVWRDEYRFQLGDGSWATFLDRGYVARDGKGRPVRMIGAMQDITERTRAQREAEEARRNAETARAEAEEANRAKSEFLATMSHELRQPLNAILGYAQLLDMGLVGPVTAEQHDHLERLRSSGVHLLGLVNDVLDLAKVDAGRLTISRAEARATGAIESAVALIRPQAIERNIHLGLHCESGSDPVYLGDEGRVRQIVINLLSNAVKFTAPGGSVTVTCGLADTAVPGARLVGHGPWAFIRVADTGVGIPPEQVNSMFEPFVQGDSSYTRPHGGTGLGLSISRRLARLMNGDLTAVSRVGSGSTFTLWMPAGSGTKFAASLGTSGEAASIAEESVSISPQSAEGLAIFARELLGEIDATVERYIRRVRGSELPHVDSLRDTQVKDHATALIADVLNSLEVVGEARGRAPDLLRDGSEIQRLISDLHGAQRYRLGWLEEHVSRDVLLLREELERTVAEAKGAPDDVRIQARELVRRLLRVAEQISIRGYRFAKSADSR